MRRRRGDRPSAVRRRGPRRPPARHVPAPRGATCRPPGGRSRYPGVDDVVRYSRGRAGGLPLVRRPPHAPCLPVRPRALLHALRARQPRGRAGAARRRRAVSVDGRQPGPARRHRPCPSSTSACPGAARPHPAAAPAQGLREASAPAGAPGPRVRFRSTGAPSPTGTRDRDRWRVAPGCYSRAGHTERPCAREPRDAGGRACPLRRRRAAPEPVTGDEHRSHVIVARRRYRG